MKKLFQKILFLFLLSCSSYLFAQSFKTKTVTASDYCLFLNAVAASDPHHLYNETMEFDATTASIVREGAPGRWRYEVIAGYENCSITGLSFLDEARYCNWLQNGKLVGEPGVASLEQGAYMLDEMDDDDFSWDQVITKNPTAVYWIADDGENGNNASASIADESSLFAVATTEKTMLILAAVSTATSTSNFNSYIEDVSGVAGFIGLLACPELMMRMSGDAGAVRTASSELTERDAAAQRANNSALTLDHFGATAEAHPTASRFIVKEEEKKPGELEKIACESVGSIKVQLTKVEAKRADDYSEVKKMVFNSAKAEVAKLIQAEAERVASFEAERKKVDKLNQSKAKEFAGHEKIESEKRDAHRAGTETMKVLASAAPAAYGLLDHAVTMNASSDATALSTRHQLEAERVFRFQEEKETAVHENNEKKRIAEEAIAKANEAVEMAQLDFNKAQQVANDAWKAVIEAQTADAIKTFIEKPAVLTEEDEFSPKNLRALWDRKETIEKANQLARKQKDRKLVKAIDGAVAKAEAADTRAAAAQEVAQEATGKASNALEVANNTLIAFKELETSVLEDSQTTVNVLAFNSSLVKEAIATASVAEENAEQAISTANGAAEEAAVALSSVKKLEKRIVVLENAIIITTTAKNSAEDRITALENSLKAVTHQLEIGNAKASEKDIATLNSDLQAALQAKEAAEKHAESLTQILKRSGDDINDPSDPTAVQHDKAYVDAMEKVIKEMARDAQATFDEKAASNAKILESYVATMKATTKAAEDAKKAADQIAAEAKERAESYVAALKKMTEETKEASELQAAQQAKIFEEQLETMKAATKAFEDAKRITDKATAEAKEKADNYAKAMDFALNKTAENAATSDAKALEENFIAMKKSCEMLLVSNDLTSAEETAADQGLRHDNNNKLTTLAQIAQLKLDVANDHKREKEAAWASINDQAKGWYGVRNAKEHAIYELSEAIKAEEAGKAREGEAWRRVAEQRLLAAAEYQSSAEAYKVRGRPEKNLEAKNAYMRALGNMQEAVQQFREIQLSKATEAETASRPEEAANWRRAIVANEQAASYYTKAIEVNASARYWNPNYSYVGIGYRHEGESWDNASCSADRVSLQLFKAIEAKAAGKPEEAEQWEEAAQESQRSSEYYLKAIEAKDNISKGLSNYIGYAAGFASERLAQAIEARVAGKGEEAAQWKEAARESKQGSEYFLKAIEARAARNSADAERWEAAAVGAISASNQLAKAIQARIGGKIEKLLEAVQWEEAARESKQGSEYHLKAIEARATGNPAYAESWKNAGLALCHASDHLAKMIQARVAGQPEEPAQWQQAMHQSQSATRYFLQAIEARARGKEADAASWENAGASASRASDYLTKAIRLQYANYHLYDALEKAGLLKKAASASLQGSEYFLRAIEARAKGNSDDATNWEKAGTAISKASDSFSCAADTFGEKGDPSPPHDYQSDARYDQSISEAYLREIERRAARQQADTEALDHTSYHVNFASDQFAKAIEARAAGKPEEAAQWEQAASASQRRSEYYLKSIEARVAGREADAESWVNASCGAILASKRLVKAIEARIAEKLGEAAQWEEAAHESQCRIEYNLKAIEARAAGSSKAENNWTNAAAAASWASDRLAKAIQAMAVGKAEEAAQWKEAAHASQRRVEYNLGSRDQYNLVLYRTSEWLVKVIEAKIAGNVEEAALWEQAVRKSQLAECFHKARAKVDLRRNIKGIKTTFLQPSARDREKKANNAAIKSRELADQAAAFGKKGAR
ncbi:MAG: hypothetical protein ACH346_04070 [Chthoniobacterales bacterium]